MHVFDDTTPALDQVKTVNLGFNNEEDIGRYAIGASYDKLAEPVVGIANLNLLTNLEIFCAGAGSPLTGHMDFSGMSQLRHIECYSAEVTSIDLSGCTSLIRLCMEYNQLTELDLNPVSATLRDCRAAVQRTGYLVMTPIVGSMEQLYHYCMRDQMLTNSIPLAKLPVIEEYWMWNTGQTTTDMPISPVARSFSAASNAYDQQSVDTILIGLDTNSTIDHYANVDVSAGAPPSQAGLTAAANLQARGWSVVINS